MRAILVRIAVDHAFGRWNAPVDPKSGEFVYVPIPENPGTPFHPGLDRRYEEIVPALERFAANRHMRLYEDLGFPQGLLHRSMHLDPDFEHLTYGDDGARRGANIRKLDEGDLLVFYGGLRSTHTEDRELVYAVTGLFVVQEVVPASNVPYDRWGENAHTRKIKRGETDIVVRAKPGVSGRLVRCIPIGEFRDRAYRVRPEVLKAWGDLSVRDGYIQRSARPPEFLDATRFYGWFHRQNVKLVQQNNPIRDQRVVIVMLRRPRKSNRNEQRDDPFWEFGSFGCTGCHSRILLRLKNAREVEGARLAFAQGGPSGFRLIFLSSPVSVTKHTRFCEVRWTPADMPFKYGKAPLLVRNCGCTDFPSLKPFLEGVARNSWEARFASLFRSRSRPVDSILADELIQKYEALRRSAQRSDIARTYDEAMSPPPPMIDRTRRATYRRLLDKAAEKHTGRCCSWRKRAGKVRS